MSRTLVDQLNIVRKAMGIEPGNGVDDIHNTLVKLYRRRGLTGFHAILQFIIASYLYKKGYDVTVEAGIGRNLKADVFGEAPWGSLIVEVETGFIPRHYMLHGASYIKARVVYKLLAYAPLADEFAIAVPFNMDLANILPFEIITDPTSATAARSASTILSRFFPSRYKDLLNNIDRASLSKIYRIHIEDMNVAVEEVNPQSLYPRPSIVPYII